jgi:hypothetical protein
MSNDVIMPNHVIHVISYQIMSFMSNYVINVKSWSFVSPFMLPLMSFMSSFIFISDLNGGWGSKSAFKAGRPKAKSVK